MSPFQLVTADRILFGRGRFDEIGLLAAGLGRRMLVVTNADRAGQQGLMDRLLARTEAASVDVEPFWIKGEPEIGTIDRGLAAARDHDCDLVLGLGGGSAIDTAKAIAGLLTNGGSCLDYMEVIGEGRAIEQPALPWIAAPTTAGTGAEVTRNAVIGSREHAYKASIRSPLLLPSIALVDPELALGVPSEITARTGMDALTQCIESYTSTGANPLTDPLALSGVGRAGRSLVAAVEHGDDVEAREEMALAALISGITLTNAGLGAVHGLAAPLGAAFPVPHGTICAVLLPQVMEANLEALRGGPGGRETVRRYAEIGRVLTAEPSLTVDDAADAAVAFAAKLVDQLEITGLAGHGLTAEAIPAIVESAERASSMKFNPVELPGETLVSILNAAL